MSEKSIVKQQLAEAKREQALQARRFASNVNIAEILRKQFDQMNAKKQTIDPELKARLEKATEAQVVAQHSLNKINLVVAELEIKDAEADVEEYAREKREAAAAAAAAATP